MPPLRVPLPGPVCIVFYLTTFFILLITAPTNVSPPSNLAISQPKTPQEN